MDFETIPMATPEQVLDVVNTITDLAKHNNQSDRRISEREQVFLPIEIFPIGSETDSEDRPSFSAISRDISVGGIGIISPRELSAEQIAVRFSSHEVESTPLLMNVHYCRQVGPLHFIGASFCADWSELDPAKHQD